MPLVYDESVPIPFGERDLIYGLDTGQQKLRYFFYTTYIKKQGLSIWDGHKLDQHKIDYLTQSMGPTVPVSWATKFGTAKSFTPTDPSKKTPTYSAKSALPVAWTTSSVLGNFRDADRADFIAWIEKTRYTPQSSANPYEWNARFKRTSKAGLFWALFVKGYNVHFIVDNQLDYSDVVGGSTSAPGHRFKQFHAQYPSSDLSSSPLETVEEKRITYAELRWIYRHRNYAGVAQRVQFWENLSTGQEFKAVAAPWSPSEPRKASAWATYAPKASVRPDDNDDMALFMKTLALDFVPASSQTEVQMTCNGGGNLAAV
ncbi:hypothetical protein [Melittangium boletus]|uniref:hypothetical protein n=1 Tax=Melittangium boletus TaxID=83453 RepID=UPI003DA2805D